MPRQAIKSGLKALRAGKYIGIVGDQAFPDSDYSYPFFGTRAWTSTAPALLAYKTKSPIIVGTSHRMRNHYEVRGSEHLWPDYSKPMKEAVVDLMDRAMQHLEQSIKGSPDQWMWIHDRWKQQGIDHVKRQYRYGFVLLIFKEAPSMMLVKRLRQIFPRSFLTYWLPEGVEIETDCEVKHYRDSSEIMVRDWRYQLVLDFANMPRVRRHYRSLGAVKTLVVTPENVKQTVVKPECLQTVTI